MSFIKCNVVMLATKGKAPIKLLRNILYPINYFEDSVRFDYQHLYITSDEKIKVNDYYFNIPRNEIQQCESQLEANSLVYNPELAKLVIATTDISLTNGVIMYKVSEQFIEKYIIKYNKGNIITKVSVEYEEYLTDIITGKTKNTLKINSEDNTIAITTIKDIFTYKEVKQLCWQAYVEHKCDKYGKVPIAYIEDTMDSFNEWCNKYIK